MAGRPTLIRGNSQLFFPGMGRLSENSVVSIKNKSFSVTAEVVVPEGGAEGVIIAQGGWSVYAKNGKVKFVYNVLGIHEFTIESDVAIPAGTHQVRAEFAYDGGGLAKGGDVNLYFDGTGVGNGRVGATQPMIFSADHRGSLRPRSSTCETQLDRLSSLGLRPVPRRLLCLPGLAGRRGLGRALDVVTALIEPERWVAVCHQGHIYQ